MNCRFCNKPLKETDEVCPECGLKVQEETVTPQPEQDLETENQKLSDKKRLIAIVCCTVLVIGLAVAVLFGNRTDRPSNIQYKDSYSVNDSLAVMQGDQVVTEFGQEKLTNRLLQVIYWWSLYDFLDYNGSYLSSLGLSLTQPLESQMMLDTGNTWQQYFLSVALENWQRWQALCAMATEAGVEIDPYISQMLTEISSDLEQIALNNGYANTKELLEDELGAGSDLQTYIEYIELSEYAMQYYYELYEKLEIPASEIEAYYEQNKAHFAEENITKDSGKVVNVRHILIRPEGATLDAYNRATATDDQWEACRQKCQDMLDAWIRDGASEDAFAALAVAHSVDTGSAADGGLYTGVEQGDMVKAFDEWCFDASRQSGDSGLVKTEYGYHLMYFAGSKDIWYAHVEDELKAEEIDRQIAQKIAECASQINYQKISLAVVSLY